MSVREVTKTHFEVSCRNTVADMIDALGSVSVGARLVDVVLRPEVTSQGIEGCVVLCFEYTHQENT